MQSNNLTGSPGHRPVRSPLVAIKIFKTGYYMARKIVQIACCGVDNVQSTQCNSYVFALCSDGSLWQQPNNEGRWYQLTEIPDAPDTVEENFNSNQQIK
jgi:hypothetical protein